MMSQDTSLSLDAGSVGIGLIHGRDHPPAADEAHADESLLRAFVGGDGAALGVLAERYEPMLLGLAHGLLHQRRELAMEAVQETWVRVIKYSKSFKQGSTVRTWLYRILVNTAHDVRKRHARTTTPSVPTEQPSSPTRSATEGLAEAVNALSIEHRAIVLLCYHQGLTHTQVADVLGIPVGTLKSRLNSALTALRAALALEDSR